MNPNPSSTRPLPAFVGWQAFFARVEMSTQVFIYVAKGNRRLAAQGCYSMTD